VVLPIQFPRVRIFGPIFCNHGNKCVKLCLSDNIISDIVKPNIPDTIANIKQKSLHGRYFKELEQPEINIHASQAWLKKSNIHPETEIVLSIQEIIKNTYAVCNR
jgi:hypothetical protein